MNRTGVYLAAALSTAFLGCQRDDTALKDDIGDIKEELAEIKKLVAAGGGAARRGAGAEAGRPQRPQRPRPNPKDVYSVPIAGAPYKGAKDAKITIVKAFEFA